MSLLARAGRAWRPEERTDVPAACGSGWLARQHGTSGYGTERRGRGGGDGVAGRGQHERQLRRVLLTLVRDPHSALPRRMLIGPSGPALVAAAEAHGLIGFLVARAGPPDGLPGEVADQLHLAHGRVFASHLRCLVDLSLVDEALDRADVPWLALKGAVLAETLYETVDLRPHQDLDLLVAPGRFREAVEALERAGAVTLDRNWRLLREEVPGQLHLQLPAGTVCDLHWDLTHQEHARQALRLPAEGLLARAMTVQAGGRTLRTTGDVDTLLHLSSHACHSGFKRIIWTCDVARLVRTVRFDWDEVLRRSHGSGARLAVALTLARARRDLDAPVPDPVLRELDPSQVWTRLGGGGPRRRTRPVIGWRTDLSGAIARSTRSTTPKSLLELSRRTSGWVGELVTRRVPPTGEERILEAAGDAHDRAACLRAIEDTGHLSLGPPVAEG
jgi:hypothetical protein